MKRVLFIISLLSISIISVQFVSAAGPLSKEQIEAYRSGIKYFDIVEVMPGAGGGGPGPGVNCSTREECAQIILNSGWSLTYSVCNRTVGAQLQDNIILNKIEILILQILAELTENSGLPNAWITSLYRDCAVNGYVSTKHSSGKAADIQVSTGDPIQYGNFLCSQVASVGGRLGVGSAYPYPTVSGCNPFADSGAPRHYHIEIP